MIAYGVTLAELFENAAYGVVAHVGAGDAVSPHYDVAVMAIGDTPEELLDDWLRQLRVRGSEAGLSLTSFAVDRLEEGGGSGRCVRRPGRESPGLGGLDYRSHRCVAEELLGPASNGAGQLRRVIVKWVTIRSHLNPRGGK